MAENAFGRLYEAFVQNPLTPKIGLENLRGAFGSLALNFKPMGDAIYEEVVIDDVDELVPEMTPVRAQWVDVIDSVMSKVVLHIHGGFFVMGSAAMYANFAGRLATAARSRVLSVDYRLAPEAAFPAAPFDVLVAYNWLLSKDYEPKDIVIVGDGAGANLALSALLQMRSFGVEMPAAAVCISPWTDLSLTAKSLKTNAKNDPVVSRELLKFAAELYVGGGGDRCDVFVSPFYADLTGLPPLLLMVSDRAALLDDAMRFSKKAEFYGVDATLVVAQGMLHGWPFFAPILTEGQQAIDYLGGFVAKTLQNE